MDPPEPWSGLASAQEKCSRKTSKNVFKYKYIIHKMYKYCINILHFIFILFYLCNKVMKICCIVTMQNRVHFLWAKHDFLFLFYFILWNIIGHFYWDFWYIPLAHLCPVVLDKQMWYFWIAHVLSEFEERGIHLEEYQAFGPRTQRFSLKHRPPSLHAASMTSVPVIEEALV